MSKKELKEKAQKAILEHIELISYTVSEGADYEDLTEEEKDVLLAEVYKQELRIKKMFGLL